MMMLEPLRNGTYRVNLALPKNHLVTWTRGTVSSLVVIKPIGIRFENLTPGLITVT